jgi:hypothetical protein
MTEPKLAVAVAISRVMGGRGGGGWAAVVVRGDDGGMAG